MQYNSPPGSSSGGGSRRLRAEVNDGLPELTSEGSHNSPTNSNFDHIENKSTKSPFFNIELTFNAGLTTEGTLRMMGLGASYKVSPLKIDMLTLSFNSYSGFRIIPYCSIYGEVELSKFVVGLGGKYDYFNKSFTPYTKLSTLHFNSSSENRLYLFDIGASLGFGFNANASFNRAKLTNVLIKERSEYTEKTGRMPHRGR